MNQGKEVTEPGQGVTEPEEPRQSHNTRRAWPKTTPPKRKLMGILLMKQTEKFLRIRIIQRPIVMGKT